MEEQEHKISSYIEQQEDLKSTVSGFVRCSVNKTGSVTKPLTRVFSWFVLDSG